jgi:dephospho-CoA kinase
MPGVSSTSLVLGLAGGYCTGKDAVAAVLSEQGFRIIDVDRVGHRVLREREARELVAARFGAGVLGADGEVDRRELGRRVFGRRAELAALEGIVHPRMVERVREELAADLGPVVLNAAVLFRMGLESLCGAVLCVRAPWWARLGRARRRDGMSALQALRRIASQRGICPKLRGPGVDIYYIDNTGGVDALRERILRLLREKRLEL